MNNNYIETRKGISVILLFMSLILVQSGAAQDESLRLLHVQDQVYMLFGTDVNVTVQIGEDSLVFVDSPDPEVIPDMMSMIREISDRPAHYLITTHLDPLHIAGNDIINTLGDNSGVGLFRPDSSVAVGGAISGVSILSHENVLNRFYLTEHEIPSLTVTNTYFSKRKDFFENDEAIIVYHLPNAHTDGDSIVYFRDSDVISTGDIYTPGLYPEIDIERGGSINGLIDSLNFILELMVPGPFAEGGTYVVPGHGRIGDEIDVVEYRNMVYIVRDRIIKLMEDGASLEEVLASDPTFDYDTEYGGTRGGPTNTEFITSVYQSLQQEVD